MTVVRQFLREIGHAGITKFPADFDHLRRHEIGRASHSFATARIPLEQITPSIRGSPSGGTALAGNTWAGAP